MNFKELANKVSQCGRKIIVSAIVNVGESGVQIESIRVGKVELISVPAKGDVLVFSNLEINGCPINACITIMESDVQSIGEIGGKMVVLVETGAYYISLE